MAVSAVTLVRNPEVVRPADASDMCPRTERSVCAIWQEDDADSDKPIHGRDHAPAQWSEAGGSLQIAPYRDFT
jgi:hypothetical protein